MKYQVCEWLNLFNVIFQMLFLDLFLGGMFSTYGSAVWGISNMDPEDRSDPMNLVFPKVFKFNSFLKFYFCNIIYFYFIRLLNAHLEVLDPQEQYNLLMECVYYPSIFSMRRFLHLCGPGLYS